MNAIKIYRVCNPITILGVPSTLMVILTLISCNLFIMLATSANLLVGASVALVFFALSTMGAAIASRQDPDVIVCYFSTILSRQYLHSVYTPTAYSTRHLKKEQVKISLYGIN